MRRIAVAAGVTAAALSLAGGAVAATVFTGGSVTGAGSVHTTFQGQDVTFRVIVAARGDATAATGRLTLVSGGTRYESTARCVLVAGNSAVVVGTLTEPVDGFTEILAEFVDNGHGRSGPPDATIAGLSAPNPLFDACAPSLVDFSDAFPVEHGNFVVKPA
jgi:hypothetical protein